MKDVSPTEPGIKPKKASEAFQIKLFQFVVFAAKAPRIVSPEYPSTEAPCTQTLSPDMYDG